MRLVALAPALLLASCAIGAPPGFSKGNAWEMPLVTPLEGGPLMVPVSIDGKGPYLFVIDPDAPLTMIDVAVASEADTRATGNAEFVDESDKARNIQFAEILQLQVGTLTVKSTEAIVVPVGTFNSGGHQVRGVLGRNVLADSLVFGFDRQQGRAWLATQKGFTQPPGATQLGYELLKSRISNGLLAVSRRLVPVKVDGTTRELHVDLGDPTSQLRESLAGSLIHVPIKRSLVDETGTRRDVDHANVATMVQVGPITSKRLLFVPYADKRWDDEDIDGTLGLGAFTGYQVWDNFSSSDLFLAPEQDTDAKTRIGRWGSTQLDACAQPACVTTVVEVPAPAAVAPPPADPDEAVPVAAAVHPVMTVTRDASVASQPIEVLLEARTSSGKPTGQPRFIVIFPAGETTAVQEVDAAYSGMTMTVLDVSPFPRACPEGVTGACVYSLGI